MGWAARILLVLAGLITSMFVAREALNFEIVRMVIAVILFTLIVMIVAFWPALKNWFKRMMK